MLLELVPLVTSVISYECSLNLTFSSTIYHLWANNINKVTWFLCTHLPFFLSLSGKNPLRKHNAYKKPVCHAWLLVQSKQLWLSICYSLNSLRVRYGSIAYGRFFFFFFWIMKRIGSNLQITNNVYGHCL